LKMILIQQHLVDKQGSEIDFIFESSESESILLVFC